MDESFNEKWAAMQERLRKPDPSGKDNREPGAYWPAPNSQDLPDDSMDVIDPS